MPVELTLIHHAARVALLILMAAMFLALYRLVRGPNLPDRVIALDLIATLALGMIVAYAILTGQPVFLNAAVILALIAFLGTVAFAKYIERRMSE
ncbi:MAG: cation:proton antiporter [Calditrichaceae bacterium]|nr:cation:proton antiporter [Calditrichia bacterium]NUQ41176.1 cation:proton antiporter [Calditrichaceae bacterium]